MKRKNPVKNQVKRSVSGSSRLEGLSLLRAKKDKNAINLLQKHGRAFTLFRTTLSK